MRCLHKFTGLFIIVSCSLAIISFSRCEWIWISWVRSIPFLPIRYFTCLGIPFISGVCLFYRICRFILIFLFGFRDLGLGRRNGLNEFFRCRTARSQSIGGLFRDRNAMECTVIRINRFIVLRVGFVKLRFKRYNRSHVTRSEYRTSHLCSIHFRTSGEVQFI